MTDDGDLVMFDAKLYLNYSTTVQPRREQDIAGNITKGRANWPAVLEK